MNAIAYKFLDEIRADPRYAPAADQMEQGLEEIFAEADENGDALELTDGLTWIMKQPRPLEDRLAAHGKLLSLKGKVRIKSLREFLGWE
jgi:hypothetical protein